MNELLREEAVTALPCRPQVACRGAARQQGSGTIHDDDFHPRHPP
jgi:hypothetical protein